MCRGLWSGRPRTRRQTSTPSISGIIQSRMASFGDWGAESAAQASAPLLVLATS